jgi:HEAT repeat protein
MRRCLLVLAAAFLMVVTLSPGAALALGTEEFGDEELSAANYTEWPGLFEVASDKCRVYSNWVNGNENFYFRGNTDQLNEALKKFAAIKVEKHEVLVRPGPGKAHSFNSERILDCNWHVNVYGGISKHVTTQDKADKVWSADPTMTIWVGGAIDLAKIKIPEGVTVLGVNEKAARARQGLGSKESMVRGWGSSVVADLNPYDPENFAAVEKLLKDEDKWVRMCAAGTIKQFGARAKPALELLKEHARSDDENLKKAAADAIAAIEGAKEDAAAAKEFETAVQQIAEFKQRLKP